VAVIVCALHGFAAFAETAAPEDVMDVLAQFHAAVDSAGGTLARLSGDAVTIVLGDPLAIEDPAGTAVALALSLRDRLWELGEAWTRLGFTLSPAIGVAFGHATIGRVGSDRRWEYAAVGPAPLLAERLCEAATAGQILISRRVSVAVPEALTSPLQVALRGFDAPVPAWDLLAKGDSPL
jgi:class 3 adenylate cyclase